MLVITINQMIAADYKELQFLNSHMRRELTPFLFFHQALIEIDYILRPIYLQLVKADFRGEDNLCHPASVQHRSLFDVLTLTVRGGSITRPRC